MKNDTVTLQDGSIDRPTFRRISLSQWEALFNVPFGGETRLMAGYGKTRPEAAADLQRKIDEANP